jgi:hypothetical protein
VNIFLVVEEKAKADQRQKGAAKTCNADMRAADDRS